MQVAIPMIYYIKKSPKINGGNFYSTSTNSKSNTNVFPANG